MKEERVIVLSWIQNFFQKLRKEEEFDEDILENKRFDESIQQGNAESIKDLETRISYQYPKLTNDYLKKPKVERKAEERLTRTEQRKESRSERNKQQETTKTNNGHAVPVKEEKKPAARSRRPFHPTEIPSPVYGFNRPKNTKVIVEHELSNFFHEATPEIVLNEVEQFTTSSPEMLEVPKAEPFVNRTNMEDPAETATDLVELETATDLVELETATDLVELETATDLVELETATDFVELENTTEMEAPVEKPAKVEETVVNSPRAEQHISDSINEEVLEPKPEEKAHEEVKPQRSRLPFNVMMLKQDREKWEQRKKERRAIEAIPNNYQEKQPQLQQEAVRVVEEQASSPAASPLQPVSEASMGQRELDNMEIPSYYFPESSLLHPPVVETRDTKWLLEQEELLNQTLLNFNVGASVVHVTQGPAVTRFEVQPEPGVKVNKITNLSDDIKLSLAAKDIRIEAPIPGKHTIGIEVPNQKSRPVFINEIIQSSVFHKANSPLTAVLGLDIEGNPIVTDLKKMPHGLIAGATGSGKSVCINTILVSLLFKASPEDLKLLLIDPKMVELAPYNRIPHLVSPVITDVKAATASLKWAVEEMERRYELFAHAGVREINRFNELAMEHKRYSDKLPFIVIIIDELADLMMMSPADVEEAICRIAQKARACGIHLIVATQRPSVDVITGLIKANIPTRIAFSVSSQVDSRTIIDISGAEKLLGRGDMLFLENGASKPVRLQGTYVSDEEIDIVVAHVRNQGEPNYLFEQEELLKKVQVSDDEDELFYEACEFIVEQGGASTSSLQRRFKIGYNRAARLMDMLEGQGFISAANGSKAREVLITEDDLESIQESSLL